MSIFDNPSFYISIFSSICFAASEILPFLPTKGNGILHAILECLSKYNKTQAQIEEEAKDIRELNAKIDILMTKLNTSLNTSLHNKNGGTA